MKLAIALALGALVALPAAAAEKPKGQAFYQGHPLRTLKFFPNGDMDKAIVGLSCMMTPRHKLERCQVAYNSHSEARYGQAALAMASDVEIDRTGAARILADEAAHPHPDTPEGAGWLIVPFQFCRLYSECRSVVDTWNATGHRQAAAFARARFEGVPHS